MFLFYFSLILQTLGQKVFKWQSHFKLYLPTCPMYLILFHVFVTVVLSPRSSFCITSRNTCTSMLVITIALLFNYLVFKCNLTLSM